MTKRTLAAMLVLLVAASTLAVVAASPAAAHTKTVQRCSYDPFAGNQCWTETVAHTHTPPPTCGAGMSGTYPNCYPAPSTNQQNTADEEAKQRAEEARKKAEAEKQRKAAEEAKRKADAEARRQRRAAEEEARRRAAAEAERKRKEAEAAEAERKRKEAEAKKKAEKQAQTCPPRQTGTPPNCRTDLRLCGTPSSAAHARECEAERRRQKAEQEAKWKKAQEEAKKPEPCGSSGGQGSTPHHKHGGPCHADTSDHTHASSTAKCPSSYKYNADTEKCELTGAVKITQDVGKVIVRVEGEVLCTVAGTALATKLVNSVAKEANELAKELLGFVIAPAIEDPCGAVWNRLTDWAEKNTYKPDTADPNGDSSDDAPADPNEPDSTDYTHDGGAHARKMCAEHNVAYFCDLVKDNEPAG